MGGNRYCEQTHIQFRLLVPARGNKDTRITHHPNTRKMKEMCNIKGCENAATVRGLCSECKSAASYLTSRGSVRWHELKDLGIISPPFTDSTLSRFEMELERLREERKEKTPE